MAAEHSNTSAMYRVSLWEEIARFGSIICTNYTQQLYFDQFYLKKMIEYLREVRNLSIEIQLNRNGTSYTIIELTYLSELPHRLRVVEDLNDIAELIMEATEENIKDRSFLFAKAISKNLSDILKNECTTLRGIFNRIPDTPLY